MESGFDSKKMQQFFNVEIEWKRQQVAGGAFRLFCEIQTIFRKHSRITEKKTLSMRCIQETGKEKQCSKTGRRNRESEAEKGGRFSMTFYLTVCKKWRQKVMQNKKLQKLLKQINGQEKMKVSALLKTENSIRQRMQRKKTQGVTRIRFRPHLRFGRGRRRAV